MENMVIDSFNGRFRDECLKANAFISLYDARQKIEVRRVDDNKHRPHGSRRDLTSQQFSKQAVQPGLQQAANLRAGML